MGGDNHAFAKPGNAKWTVEPRSSGVFNVRAPDGSIYGTYENRTMAEGVRGTLQRRDDLAARKTTRPCMCCQKPFESEGIHNRMCGSCRPRSADEEGSLQGRDGRRQCNRGNRSKHPLRRAGLRLGPEPEVTHAQL